jgi:putative ABC transport system substrate-binding protein
VDRRAFLIGSGALLTSSLAAEAAPQAGKVPRVGVVSLSHTTQESVGGALRKGLRDLGYVEGQTIALEYRLVEGKEERFSDLASELVHLKVDVIFATVAAAVRAAQHATKTIPIVTVVNDP